MVDFEAGKTYPLTTIKAAVPSGGIWVEDAGSHFYDAGGDTWCVFDLARGNTTLDDAETVEWTIPESTLSAKSILVETLSKSLRVFAGRERDSFTYLGQGQVSCRGGGMTITLDQKIPRNIWETLGGYKWKLFLDEQVSFPKPDDIPAMRHRLEEGPLWMAELTRWDGDSLALLLREDLAVLLYMADHGKISRCSYNPDYAGKLERHFHGAKDAIKEAADAGAPEDVWLFCGNGEVVLLPAASVIEPALAIQAFLHFFEHGHTASLVEFWDM